MTPKRVTLENFLSFGDKQEITFDQDEVLWVIGGPNGVGKSAVFDAMTYCLFGTHRASGRMMKDRESNLIRHGAAGFHVAFEFEFAGIDYRISRNRKRSGKQPTQSVEQRQSDGTWQRVPHVNDAKELNEWVEKTLGLGCDAFQASVLLRQGKADEFVDAKPTDRFAILKRIINLDRYEKLSDAVHEATLTKQRELKSYEKQRDTAELVTDEQLLQAETVEQEARVLKEQLALALQSALTGKAAAKSWTELEAKRQAVLKLIASARELEANAVRIQQSYTRLTQLNEWLPRLTQHFALRKTIAETEPKLQTLRKQKDTAEQKLAEVTTQLKQASEEANACKQQAKDAGAQAEQLTASIKRQKQCLEAAESLSKLEKQLEAFPEKLDKELAKAREAHSKLVYAQANARDEVARLKGLFAVAEQHQKAIAKMKSGVKCTACGQPVTAEHAKKERAQATKQVEQATSELEAAQETFEKESAKVVAQTKLMEASQSQVAERDQLQQQYDISRQSLTQLGSKLNVKSLQREITELTAQQKQQQQLAADASGQLNAYEATVKRLDAESKAADRKAKAYALQFQEADKALASDRGKCQAIQEHLPADWTTLKPGDVPRLASEQLELQHSRVEERHQQLQQASTSLNIWQQQLAEHDTALAAIPEAARVSVTQAEQAEASARSKAKQADDAWQTARDQFQATLHKAKAFEQLRQQIGQLEQDVQLHVELDQQLGKTGLQRDLMRDAELQIVNLAHQTLQQLTDGELALELNENKDDEALNLCVRGASATLPTPLDYLSGSQKFRVAIAIALAIGRYSTGQSRPLESVIIDEGFGSLDKDGLNAMADELKQLQRKQSLRRIILVSHQEDFVDRFNAGYKLTPSENGTIATSWRK